MALAGAIAARHGRRPFHGMFRHVVLRPYIVTASSLDVHKLGLPVWWRHLEDLEVFKELKEHMTSNADGGFQQPEFPAWPISAGGFWRTPGGP